MTTVEKRTAKVLAQATINYYDRYADDFVRGEQLFPITSALRNFRLMLPNRDHPSILDFGCGSGRALRLFQELDEEGGLPGATRYLGIDASQGMLAIARREHPDFAENFLCGDIRNLQDVLGEKCNFDGFFAKDSLGHIPRAEITPTLQSIRSVLVDEAIGFMTLPYGIQTGVLNHENTEGMIPQGHAILMEGWTPEDLEPHLRAAHFEVLPRHTFVEQTATAMGNIAVLCVTAIAVKHPVKKK